jgi:hypothetical protein
MATDGHNTGRAQAGKSLPDLEHFATYCQEELGIDTTTPEWQGAAATVFCSLKSILAGARDNARERMALRKKEGKALNGEPGYGFRMIGRKGRRKKVPDPEERRVMAALVRWRREGYTFEEIYRHLRDYKVKTRAGREWSLKRIQRAYQAAVRTAMVPAGPDGG